MGSTGKWRGVGDRLRRYRWLDAGLVFVGQWDKIDADLLVCPKKAGDLNPNSAVVRDPGSGGKRGLGLSSQGVAKLTRTEYGNLPM